MVPTEGTGAGRGSASHPRASAVPGHPPTRVSCSGPQLPLLPHRQHPCPANLRKRRWQGLTSSSPGLRTQHQGLMSFQNSGAPRAPPRQGAPAARPGGGGLQAEDLLGLVGFWFPFWRRPWVWPRGGKASLTAAAGTEGRDWPAPGCRVRLGSWCCGSGRHVRAGRARG